MLLKYYLISSAIAIIICFIQAKAVVNKYNRNNMYGITVTPVEYVSVVFVGLVPIVNVILIFMYMFCDELLLDKIK